MRRVLCVDDDPNVLRALRRNLMLRVPVEVAGGGAEALDRLRHDGPFAVVVTDMQMPGMDGLELLRLVQAEWPDTVRIMLTGHADLDLVVAAINRGHIFRFLSKPCPVDLLLEGIEAGIGQYELVTAERELLSRTVLGLGRLLVEVLALCRPGSFGRALRVRRIAKRLAGALGVAVDWRLELASMLAPIGTIALPDQTVARLRRGESVTGQEWASYERQARLGRNLVAAIPRLASVAELLDPPTPKAEAPAGARILRLAMDYDRLRMAGATPSEALEELAAKAADYGLAELNALRASAFEAPLELRLLSAGELSDGMILAEDVLDADGSVVAAGGLEASAPVRQRVLAHAELGRLREPLRVLVDVESVSETG